MSPARTAALLALLPSAAPMATWKNSTEGIHAFLTFDSDASLPAIAQYGSRIDYVWGADSKPEHVAAWRKANPDVVLSKYIPYTRDPSCPHLSGTDGPQCSAKTPGFKPGCPDCLPWWKANHPDLVLYQCGAPPAEPPAPFTLQPPSSHPTPTAFA